MRSDGKVAQTVYVGNGVKSIEWIDPPVKKKVESEKEKEIEPKSDRHKKD